MPLETESKYFDRERDRWVAAGHEGEWVVVHGEQVLDFYPTIEDGFAAGAKAFGPGKFLLKRVTREDRVETIQRAYWGRGEHRQAG